MKLVTAAIKSHKSEDVLAAIVSSAQTGRIGDGKVWGVPSVVRVRAGERDEGAI